MAIYYYGWESRCETGIEAAASYGTAPLTGAFFALSYLRSMTVNVNENVERITTANRATGLWTQTEVKGAHLATATLKFWMPDDMSATVNETWFLKAPLDEFNVAHDATKWVVPNTGTSVYGSNALQSYTYEIAFNKSGSVVGWRLHGGYVNKMNMVINKANPIEFTYDIVCQYAERITAFTNGAATVLASTVPPLNWSNVTLQWKGEDDALSTHTDFTNVSITLENDLMANQDIVLQTINRVPSEYIMGYTNGRRITGNITVNRTTTTGQKWEEIVLSATAAATNPSATIQLGQLTLQVNSVITSAKNFKYTFYNVVIGELPQDIDFSKVQELTIPITAQYYLWEFTTADTTGITLWDDQS